MLRLLPVLFLLLGSACTSTQHASTDSAATLSDVEYEVPERFTEANAASDERIALFERDNGRVGLFVAALPDEADRGALMEEVQQRLASLAAEGQPQTFDWRPNLAPLGDQRASDFEVYNERRHGFNGQSRVVVQFRQIEKEGRNLLTGYYYVAGTGAQAEQQFRNGTVGDSAVAGPAWASLIGSIVGEQPRDLSGPPPPAPPPGN